jgi:hypothetical protein
MVRALSDVSKDSVRNSQKTIVLEQFTNVGGAGAKTVLRAAAAAKVKRVVFTSSVVTLYNAVKATSKKPDGSLYGPDDWNTESTVESNCYLYSKVEVRPPPPPPLKPLDHHSLVLPAILTSFLKRARFGWRFKSSFTNYFDSETTMT